MAKSVEIACLTSNLTFSWNLTINQTLINHFDDLIINFDDLIDNFDNFDDLIDIFDYLIDIFNYINNYWSILI